MCNENILRQQPILPKLMAATESCPPSAFWHSATYLFHEQLASARQLMQMHPRNFNIRFTKSQQSAVALLQSGQTERHWQIFVSFDNFGVKACQLAVDIALKELRQSVTVNIKLHKLHIFNVKQDQSQRRSSGQWRETVKITAEARVWWAQSCQSSNQSSYCLGRNGAASSVCPWPTMSLRVWE